MGAWDKLYIEVGRYKNASEAYDQLVKEEIYEHGHDGYNGTISTAAGFFMREDHPRYGTKKWNDFYEKTLDGTKFSNWNCIEIKGSFLKKLKEDNGYKGKRNIKAFAFWGLAAT